jgi:hypothetical protein
MTKNSGERGKLFTMNAEQHKQLSSNRPKSDPRKNTAI